jgi:FkbM family methyltransferase
MPASDPYTPPQPGSFAPDFGEAAFDASAYPPNFAGPAAAPTPQPMPPPSIPPLPTMPHSAAAGQPAATLTPSDELRRKAELEAAMVAAPADPALRAAYFDHLMGMSQASTGLIWANLPDVGSPLAFRAGTPDVAVMAQVFRDNMLAFEMRPTPLQIVVIGAHAGYTAVDLARRYPRARLLCAEPLPDNFRLLSLNTSAWRRIRVANVALWHSTARLAATGRYQGDWAVRLTDEGIEEDRGLAAMSLHQLLGRAGWRHADLIVCDASGAEREVFTDPLQPWVWLTDAVLVRLHEQMAPGATAMVEACFPPADYDRRSVGSMELFTRRIPRTAEPPLPADLSLLRAEPGLKPFRLSDTPNAAWGFFVFDGGSCQLHPNAPGDKPSRVLFGVPAPGHFRFVANIVHAGIPGAEPIVFTVIVLNADGTPAGRAEATLRAKETGRLTLPLPELTGAYHVLLQTEMAPGAAHNQMAWSRWLEPRLV